MSLLLQKQKKFRCSTCLVDRPMKGLIVLDLYSHHLVICNRCQVEIYSKISRETMNKGEDLIVKNQESFDEFNRKRQEKAEKAKERIERRILKNGV